MKEKESSPDYQWQGSPPLHLKIFLLQVLVCSLCEAVFKASLPETNKVPDDLKETPPSSNEVEIQRCNRYASANTQVALFRYMYGVATYRLAKIMALFGLPLAESTQWHMIYTLSRAILPLYKALLNAASQAGLVMNDDTRMKILSYKPTQSEPPKEENSKGGKSKKTRANKERTSTRTSCVLAFVQNYKITLYFTGPQIAGEALNKVLKDRDKALPSPLHMCDGLSHNDPKNQKVIQLQCLSHARRKFYFHWERNKEKFEELMSWFRAIYKVDEKTKKEQLDPYKRLLCLQELAKPYFEKIHHWLKEEKEKEEPNSLLGKDISYCLKRWNKLTECLKVQGAPLTNDETERAIKDIVLHRKNSLFYKTLNGAEVGDIIMSIIQTAKNQGINPFEYLNDLQIRRADVEKNPHAFLPWNWKK